MLSSTADDQNVLPHSRPSLPRNVKVLGGASLLNDVLYLAGNGIGSAALKRALEGRISGTFRATEAVRRPTRAAARPGRGNPPWSAGRTEPRRFPPATPAAATPCACPGAKAGAARCPKGSDSGPPTPPPACPRPTSPPGCTATGSG